MEALSTQLQFNKVSDTAILDPLKADWRSSLTAAQDDMWEVFMEYAAHWEMLDAGKRMGYACVNEEGQLLQFYLSPKWIGEGERLLQQFIQDQEIKEAVVGSNNPIYMSIAMQCQKQVSVHTLLFAELLKVELEAIEGSLKTATPDDLERLVDFCHESMGGPKEWLQGYISGLIEKEEFFVFEQGEEILGTCEVRRSKSDPAVANLGMVVSHLHRRKGLGTFLLSKAKEIANERGLRAICSCEKGNIGSTKAIQRNGFRARHQMLLMKF